MKKISICIPCYNEEKNIPRIYSQISNIMQELADYQYELIFADNHSSDRSEEVLRQIATEDTHVKVILNMRNFGPGRSGKNVLFAADGDAAVSLACDLQDPPEMIPQFIKNWEKGNAIVWGQKVGSREGKLKYLLRELYYKIIAKCSDTPQYRQITGFGLMDRSIIQMLESMEEPDMSPRHLIAELGYPVLLLPYLQQQRCAGKSSYNLWRYFDFAINSLVRTSRLPLRMATLLGCICSATSFFTGIVYLFYKLICWHTFEAGIAPIAIAVFFLGSIQLLFIGLIGEYIGVILSKVTKRPLVVEKERINFKTSDR